MSAARICLFCEKPLSRLRVGGDGDFCSKEHRNSYRLRAGMDRLAEVNKVANLMRRRENARQIAPAALICNSALGRRGFLDAQPVRIDSNPRVIELRPAAPVRPRITAFSDRCVEPRIPASVGPLPSARAHDGVVGLALRNPNPLVPERRHRVRVEFPQNPPAALRSLAVKGARAHRDLPTLPPSGIRAHLGNGPRSLRKAHRVALVRAARPHSFSPRPVEGNALRVSSAMAFRVPPVQQLQRQSALYMSSALRPVHRVRTLQTDRLDHSSGQRPLLVAMPELSMMLPTPPVGVCTGGFDARGAMRINGRIFRDSTVQTPRSPVIPWRASEPRLRAAKLSQTLAGFSRRNGAHLFNLTLGPAKTQGSPQLSESPFVGPGELIVPRVPFRNVLAAAVVTPDTPPEMPRSAPAAAPSAPAPPVPAAAAPEREMVRYEENFDEGWDNWVGGVADWKVDVAGVRIGSLALYLPSLDLSDYDLEFLGRIDTRSLNWVVRASGNDTHLRCTLTVVDGNQIEFSRAVVKAGSAEATVTAAQRAPGKPRTAMTVHMSVAGPVFSISVDGKTIDSWVDDRLATGGIGFVGAPEDRARIYWVRVCTPAGPNKEHTLQ